MKYQFFHSTIMIKEVKNIEKLAERFVRRKILSSKKMVSPKIFIRVFTELKGQKLVVDFLKLFLCAFVTS